MPTLATAFATTYIDVCKTGRTRPCRFTCLDANNVARDYIVKFFGVIGPQVICEVAAAVIGKRLGLNLPQMAIVYIDPGMADVVSDSRAREQLKRHPGPHFGSRDIGPGAVVLNPGYTLSGEALEQALDLFAFDMFIRNTNRTTTGHPNLLFKGNDLYPVGHHRAFSFINESGNSSRAPWQLRDTPLPAGHIFYSRLRSYARNNPISFDRFLTHLAALHLDDIDVLGQHLPPPWLDERIISGISQHCRRVVANVDKFRTGLLEVFV